MKKIRITYPESTCETCSRKSYVKKEEHFFYDELHRPDGPAVIVYDRKGNIIHQDWFIYGRNATNAVNEWFDENKCFYTNWTNAQKSEFFYSLFVEKIYLQ